MGNRPVRRAAPLDGFSLENRVPADHLLHAVDRFVAPSEIRRQHALFDGATGRPSVDPELRIRMLLIGDCRGLRSSAA